MAHKHEGVTRRDAMKAVVAASAGMMLSRCGTSDPFARMGTGKRSVIVVGAGLAGLACAHELVAVGYEVIVLEARNRIGGRVLTLKDMAGGKVVEAGGEFVGANHATWASFAAKFGLNLRRLEADAGEKPIVIGGKKLGADEAKKVMEEMATARVTLNEATRGVDADRPWQTAGAEELDAQSMGDWLRSVQATDVTKKVIRAEFEGRLGVGLEHMSYLAFLAMLKGGGVEKFWTDSQAFRCAEGAGALAEKLAGKLGKRIVLGSPAISMVLGNQRAMVTTESQRLEADDVVMTVPPSTWGKIHMTPELPASLKPQMGVAVKYLAGVKRQFWKDAGMSAEAITDGEISLTWEATAGQGDGAAVLACLSGGPAAERARIREPMARTEFYRSEIAKIFPGYGENTKEARFMDWAGDPWTLGAYSFGAPGRMKVVGPALEQGMECLHFAGEYASWAFPGTMEGALESGVRAARRLAKRDGAAA